MKAAEALEFSYDEARALVRREIDLQYSLLLEQICRCETNKAPIRFLLSILIAKIETPAYDLHKPNSRLGDGAFSGRSYDEVVVQPFIHKNNLPCNSTTAYLTPAFRTIETPLEISLFKNCRPKEVYATTIQIIDFLQDHPDDCLPFLTELMRLLLLVKVETETRMSQLIQSIKTSSDSLPLSSEDIKNLLVQHLQLKGSSRLPVLIITAAYMAVSNLIKEINLPLQAHNAADKQTGSLGDVEIILIENESIVTCYEMKDKRVSRDDIDVCLAKLAKIDSMPHNYIIITTDTIDPKVYEYAISQYDSIGVEFVILDCIGFIHHFLHFFHRYRLQFLESYQRIVLSEPTSSVSQPLKEAFLALRRVAETSKNRE